MDKRSGSRGSCQGIRGNIETFKFPLLGLLVLILREMKERKKKGGVNSLHMFITSLVYLKSFLKPSTSSFRLIRLTSNRDFLGQPHTPTRCPGTPRVGKDEKSGFVRRMSETKTNCL